MILKFYLKKLLTFYEIYAIDSNSVLAQDNFVQNRQQPMCWSHYVMVVLFTDAYAYMHHQTSMD